MGPDEDIDLSGGHALEAVGRREHHVRRDEGAGAEGPPGVHQGARGVEAIGEVAADHGQGRIDREDENRNLAPGRSRARVYTRGHP